MTVRILRGDCLDVLRGMPEASVHCCVTDPPYGLEFMGVAWDTFSDRPKGKRRARNEWGDFGSREHARHPSEVAAIHRRKSLAFEEFSYTWARAVYDVLLPGAHLVAFGGTRTFHRMACAIEDAGFEIRDTLCWLYGSGFPKSLDVSKAIDRTGGESVSWFGPWLREHREAIGLSQKELADRGGFFKNINHGGLVANWELGYGEPTAAQFNKVCELLSLPFRPLADVKREVIGQRKVSRGVAFTSEGADVLDITAPATPEAAAWAGWGTALKPAYEPIILARKPLQGTVAANVLAHGTGALNVDACRVACADGDKGDWPLTQRRHADVAYTLQPVSTDQSKGRWPANVLHDGSDEVEAAFAAFGEKPSSFRTSRNHQGGDFGWKAGNGEGHNDTGSASRFFYSSKAGPNDRVSRLVEEVEIEWTSESKRCRLVLQADTEQSPQKAIVVFPSEADSGWSTFLSGSMFAALCQRASKCIISTTTSSTTGSRISSCLMRSLTSASTAVVASSKANGSSPVGNAAQSILSATITLDATEYLPGASRAASGTQLRINVCEKRVSHPTVKPVALMRWLVRLVCPPGGTCLDPFAGSGTTGEAAMLEGFDALLIERDEQHADDIAHRIKRWSGADLPLLRMAATA